MILARGALALALALASTACAGPSDPAGAPNPRIATDWIREVARLVRDESTLPPQASRVFAYTSMAIDQAVRAANAMGLEPDHVESVVSAAVGDVLIELLPGATTRVEAYRHPQLTDASPYAQELGHGVAARIVDATRSDGFARTRGLGVEMPVGDPYWVPTGILRAPTEPHWGSLRPFMDAAALAACADQIAPPVPYSTEDDSAMAQEARAVVNGRGGDHEDFIAYYWSDAPARTSTPAGHWMEIAAQVIDERELPLSDASALLARAGMAAADAFIIAWRLKYQYNLLRPVTYIRRVIDPAWTPRLITPGFPEYVSGHAAVSGAVSAVLDDAFAAAPAFVDRTRAETIAYDSGEDPHPLSPRAFPSFAHAAEEAADSRLFGGIHFPMGNAAGLAAGRCVAMFHLADQSARSSTSSAGSRE
mgnify:CR=1 FL=1